MLCFSSSAEKGIIDELTVAVYAECCKMYMRIVEKYKLFLDGLKSENVTVKWYGKCDNEGFETDCLNLRHSEACFSTIANKTKFALALEIFDTNFISDQYYNQLR